MNSDVVSIKDLAEYFETKNENFKISPREISDEDLYGLLGDIFNYNDGKITHLEQLLLWFPDYLNLHFQTKTTLMMSSGPLPIDWRFYIAIMVNKFNKF